MITSSKGSGCSSLQITLPPHPHRYSLRDSRSCRWSSWASSRASRSSRVMVTKSVLLKAKSWLKTDLSSPLLNKQAINRRSSLSPSVSSSVSPSSFTSPSGKISPVSVPRSRGLYVKRSLRLALVKEHASLPSPSTRLAKTVLKICRW